MNRLLFALALLLGLAAPAHALRVDNMDFADRMKLGGQELVLNGVGFRAVLVYKGYAAALWLPQRATTAAQVQAVPGPKRLQMRMLVDVPAPEFSRAFLKGVRRNTPAAELPALTERMARFDAQILALQTVKKGDVVDLDYLPDAGGLTMRVNGRARGEPIAGDEFYAALLRVFIGQKVSDDELRAGLLGGPAR
jgi:hypothetical protein